MERAIRYLHVYECFLLDIHTVQTAAYRTVSPFFVKVVWTYGTTGKVDEVSPVTDLNFG